MKTIRPHSYLLLLIVVAFTGCTTCQRTSSSSSSSDAHKPSTVWASLLGIAETSAYDAARQNSEAQSH